MSDGHRSDDEFATTAPDITEWVERASPDPHAYLERQAIEVFLTALGLSQSYSQKIFLKGGLLMVIG